MNAQSRVTSRCDVVIPPVLLRGMLPLIRNAKLTNSKSMLQNSPSYIKRLLVCPPISSQRPKYRRFAKI